MDITSLKKDTNINLIKKAAKETDIEVFIIGGVLRDMVLGIEKRDYDFVVFGDVRILTDKVSELLGRPIIHIGTGGKDVIRIVKDDTTYDFTHSKGTTIEKDIPQRDFTINTFAFSLLDEKLIDILGAKKDIDAKTIRMASADAFDYDPLRMLRAFRFMAELGFDIDDDTLNSIAQKKTLIQDIAGERVREEFFRILAVKDSYKTIKAMSDCGLLYELFPELTDSVGCVQNEYHHFDVMEHTLYAYENLEDITSRLKDFFPKVQKELEEYLVRDGSYIMLKYSILFHDIAKPLTKSKGEDGRVHFYRHCEEGEKIVEKINERLRLSNKQDSFARNVIRQHLRVVPFLRSCYSHIEGKCEDSVTKKSILRYFMRLGDIGAFVIVHNLADLIAARGIKLAQENEVKKIISLSNMMLDIYFNEYMLKKKNPPLITGKHLIEKFGLTPSPLFKTILDAVYDKQITGEIKTLQEANAVVMGIIPKRQR